MSGGSLGYFYSDLDSHVGDFGDKELDDLIKDLAELFHAREWYLSSDTCEGEWIEARDVFKAKWFGENSRNERIEKYMDEIRDDVLKQFGISEKYCKNCKRWTQDEREHYEKYGNCEVTKGCLMHRHESCEKFEHK